MQDSHIHIFNPYLSPANAVMHKTFNKSLNNFTKCCNAQKVQKINGFWRYGWKVEVRSPKTPIFELFVHYSISYGFPIDIFVHDSIWWYLRPANDVIKNEQTLPNAVMHKKFKKMIKMKIKPYHML